MFLLKILRILWFLGKCFDISCKKILPILIFMLLEKVGLNQMIFHFCFRLLSFGLLLFPTQRQSLLKPLSFNASWYDFQDLYVLAFNYNTFKETSFPKLRSMSEKKIQQQGLWCSHGMLQWNADLWNFRFFYSQPTWTCNTKKWHRGLYESWNFSMNSKTNYRKKNETYC